MNKLGPGRDGGGDGAMGGEIFSLGELSKGMLLVFRQRDRVEKQCRVQLWPGSSAGMGQPGLAVSLAAATFCLLTAGSAWRGGEGTPAEMLVSIFFVGIA